MPVKETSDDNLIIELIKNERVILKYHTDTCGKICEELKLIYTDLSNHGAYEKILFLLINADDNPIAKKHIEAKKQPIMNIYHKGILVECRTVDSKERIRNLLDKLLNHSTANGQAAHS